MSAKGAQNILSTLPNKTQAFWIELVAAVVVVVVFVVAVVDVVVVVVVVAVVVVFVAAHVVDVVVVVFVKIRRPGKKGTSIMKIVLFLFRCYCGA